MATVTPSTNPRNANPPDNPERHRQRREPQPPWPTSTARDSVLDGVEMGAWDRRVAGWLAGLDTCTALTIASWILRAREAGQER